MKYYLESAPATNQKLMSLIYKKKKHIGLPFTFTPVKEQLNAFIEKYELEALVEREKSDLQKFLKLEAWVNENWAIICDSPEAGNFQFLLKHVDAENITGCPGYVALLLCSLQALGFKARKLWLNADISDADEEEPAHELIEIYLQDEKKWFFMDPEYKIIIIKEGLPLNAVEFQQTLVHEEEIEVMNISQEICSEDYLEYIGRYLSYFTIPLHYRSNFWSKISGNKKLLTLPLVNEENPRHLGNPGNAKHVFTNSISEFYSVL